MAKVWDFIKASVAWYYDKIVGYPHLVAVIWPVTLVLAVWFF